MVVAISDDQLRRLTILLRRIKDDTGSLDKEIIDEAAHLLGELVARGKPMKPEWWEGPTQDIGPGRPGWMRPGGK